MPEFNFDDLKELIFKNAKEQEVDISEAQIDLFFNSEEEYMRKIGLVTE